MRSDRRMTLSGRFCLAAACLIIGLYCLLPSLRVAWSDRLPEPHTVSPFVPASSQTETTPVKDPEESGPTENTGAASSSPPQSSASQVHSVHAVQDCRVIKLSMLYGAHKFPQLEAAVDSHRQHSERWGCGFDNLEYDVTNRKLYSKHYFLLFTMLQQLASPPEQRAQWLMWGDADSIVINHALSPEIFLPPDNLENVFALLTRDHNGLNAGVFYLKVDPKSVDLLTQVVDYPLIHPEQDLGWFGEQEAMARVVKVMMAQQQSNGERPGIAWVPRMWFNAYEFETGYEGSPGHQMVHFAGLGATRVSQMAEWLLELETNGAKWEIPLEDTFYKAEIPTFWKEFAQFSATNPQPDS